MDLETENRIAAVLLREAAELRRQAQQEGVLAYLRKPTVRGRPNSRFISATIRGIQQVNRAVEVDEMWRVRQKELELDDRIKGRSRDYCSHSSRDGHRELSGSQSKRHDSNTTCSSSRSQSKKHDSNASCASSKRSYENHAKEDEGLRDEEIEEFLHSRVKRGRGSIGSRMDETGPYLPRSSESPDRVATDYMKDERHLQAILGPKKPSSWKHCESSEELSDDEERKRTKKTSSEGSKKKHSSKHKSKERSKDKKKKKKDKRSKH
ncbi:uncharacterized protein LOC104890977 [Beta vulgaris subsp. vulgaris]|uniref:uncharacterized protein LOC104890977 n=1 Tax=Beta vulgaris subsp. vulgaris TaxID=3555 RepID=UPI0020375152|nr:uncharacterized protein LOC104890977 [Beta vulgaris subsp. vulgaris]XP_057250320.1 uncharacterized protein LOC104890977 [Beta vulgaris subsp. vulgaris]